MARRRMGEEGKGGGWGLNGRQCRFGNRLRAVKGEGWRSAVAAQAATGRREEDDAGGREKGEKRERKGGLSPCLFGKRRRERRRGGRGRREALPPSLGGLRAERRGRGDDDVLINYNVQHVSRIKLEERLLITDKLSLRFLDPIFFGEYPREMREILSSNLPKFTPEEKKLLQNKVDFIGINQYTAIYAKDCIYSPCALNTYEGNALVYTTGVRNGAKIGKPTAFSTYFVVPESIESAVMYVNGRYKDTTIYITENGYSQHSDTNMEDLINDVERVNYLQGYLKYLSSAVRKGANVGGYFMWSLIDNFEWVFGYTIKFGLYHVDFDTQERIPKMSAKWYRDFLTGSNVTDDTQVWSRRADS
uniref:Putative beta-glucosidase 15 n=1 Tax=Oryza sativa subsp. japonica TaxID=39947 RepID=BGL15_ORYSJ|nr:PUTATIVE PSEUDOGENE: RecName: Full=Putative beta-glucosidase 15; Short=Os4bglu15 [Oryza sativa Japonica Group]CAE03399.2 OSJNBa0004N05.23 [Oryza sativa Japonica Group]